MGLSTIGEAGNRSNGRQSLGDPNEPSSGPRRLADVLYLETSVRYAKVLVAEKLAFKVNGSYLRAADWIANVCWPFFQ
jgi:iron complex outermembrane receptor protein